MKAAAPLLLALLPLAACKHTYQKEVEATPEQKLELYTTTATYLYEDGDLDKAQDQAVKALEIDPEHRAMRRMIGWIRVRKDGHEDLILAERFFRDLIEDGDENDNTRLGLAITCERLGKAYDDVARATRAGEREAPSDTSPEKHAQGLEKSAQNYWKEGVELCDAILIAGEGNTNAMNALQRLEALRGNYDLSLAWSARLLERTGEELATWRRMLEEKDLTESEERLFRKNARAALELENDTHIFAATLLFRLQRYDEGLPHLDAVVAANPELAQAYSLRGQFRARSGEYQGAVEDLDRYLALSEAPFEHPDVQRAFELRAQAAKHLEGASPR
ncbi:MAG: tetratricopeptide repeat protein [Planctomycetota bacterium]